ncbi:TIGR02281 family clan AA aspartic protease [Maricaulis sp. MIT060901]|uniref:retropepsin-like aspartic protease family protein n=1 Tax=Maricaulis sp. MIT060901 TaxID=3096993 RepID=UPI00399B7EC6
MDRFISRAALPLLGTALTLLALRLVSWPLWDDMNTLVRMIYALTILAVLFAAVMFAGHSPHGYPRRNQVLWSGVVAGFIGMALFNNEFREWELDRMWAPTRTDQRAAMDEREDTITLQRQRDGHYYLDAWAGQARVDFLVDTGATGVAISYEDARRMGIRVEALSFDLPMSTADGIAYGAGVVIPELIIRGHSFEYVRAVVMRNGERSLLGMSVLSEFSSVEISGDRLTLRR